jgi:hypothetical protein
MQTYILTLDGIPVTEATEEEIRRLVAVEYELADRNPSIIHLQKEKLRTYIKSPTYKPLCITYEFVKEFRDGKTKSIYFKDVPNNALVNRYIKRVDSGIYQITREGLLFLERFEHWGNSVKAQEFARYIIKNPGATAKDATKDLGYNRESVYNYAHFLINKGFVRAEKGQDERRKGIKKYYWVGGDTDF